MGLSLGWPEPRKGFNQVCAEVRGALSGDFQPPWVFQSFLIQAHYVLKKNLKHICQTNTRVIHVC